MAMRTVAILQSAKKVTEMVSSAVQFYIYIHIFVTYPLQTIVGVLDILCVLSPVQHTPTSYRNAPCSFNITAY